MTLIRRAALTAALILTAVAPVAAATVTYSQGVSIPTRPDWNATLSLRQFDPSLGNLTGVRVGLASTINGYTYVENLSPTGTFFFSTGGRAFVSLLGLPNANPLIAPNWQSGSQFINVFDGISNFSGADSAYPSGSNGADGFQELNDFTGYSGFGFLAAVLDVRGDGPQGYSSFQDNIYHYQLFHSDLLTAAGSITYTYDPIATPPIGGVPEPASWTLLITGFGLTGAAVRRRRQQAVRPARIS